MYQWIEQGLAHVARQNPIELEDALIPYWIVHADILTAMDDAGAVHIPDSLDSLNEIKNCIDDDIASRGFAQSRLFCVRQEIIISDENRDHLRPSDWQDIEPECARRVALALDAFVGQSARSARDVGGAFTVSWPYRTTADTDPGLRGNPLGFGEVRIEPLSPSHGANSIEIPPGATVTTVADIWIVEFERNHWEGSEGVDILHVRSYFGLGFTPA